MVKTIVQKWSSLIWCWNSAVHLHRRASSLQFTALRPLGPLECYRKKTAVCMYDDCGVVTRTTCPSAENHLTGGFDAAWEGLGG